MKKPIIEYMEVHRITMYDYEYVEREAAGFKHRFSIGQTLEGRQIYCVSVGKGDRCAVFAAAFHALEYLTADALLYAAKALIGYTGARLFFIPMVNPDGVEIALKGLAPKNVIHREIIRENGILDYRHVWQANARGVDINHNFDANWDSVHSGSAPTRFGGYYPESEAETGAVTSFLRLTKPELFIAFHSQGKEIYYDFDGMESEGAKDAAEAVGAEVGYDVCRPQKTAAFGGAKDWYIKEFHKRAFTVELGLGKNPLPVSELPQMRRDCTICCRVALRDIFLH